MIEREATGRTVEEAVENALEELGIKISNAEINVLAEPSQGLLGLIGSKEARVLVRVKDDPETFLKNYLEEMIENIGVEGQISVESDEEKVSAMINGDDVGVLIGRRGKTLNDMQYLVNIVVRRQFAHLNKMIVVDVENYRVKRERTLTLLAKNVARKVSQEGYEKTLEPMNPSERRIIHLALQDYPGIVTYSSGQEPYRKVIVAPR